MLRFASRRRVRSQQRGADMTTRIGGALLLIADVAIAVSMIGGAGWALGGKDEVAIRTGLIVGLLGVGATLIALGRGAPFGFRGARWALLAFGAGGLGLAASQGRSLMLELDPMQDWAAVLLGLGGLLALVAGALAIGVTLAMRRGLVRIVGIVLALGVLVALVSWPGEPMNAGAVGGATLVFVALGAVAVMAIVPRSSAWADVATR